MVGKGRMIYIPFDKTTNPSCFCEPHVLVPHLINLPFLFFSFLFVFVYLIEFDIN